MSHPLKSLDSRILVIDQSKVRRSEIARVLRETGFRDVIQEESLAKAVSMSDLPHWIIAPIEAGSEINAFSFLKNQIATGTLGDPHLSILCRQGEEKYIPWLFQLGLLSAHSFSDDMSQLKASFTRLLELAKKLEWQSPLIAAEGLRTYLKKLSLFSEQTELETSLLTLYPDRSDLSVNLAEALMLSGKRQQALSVLSRVKTSDHELARRVESLTDSLHDPENDSEAFARYGVKHAILIDPDESELNQLESVLSSTGVAEVMKFQKGSDAWNYLRQADVAPGLIVTEWRLPELSGARLCQRIMKKWPDAHVLVYSSLLQSSDRMIVRELGISDLIEKPKGLKSLRQALLAAFLSRTAPNTGRSVEARIRQLVAAGRLNEAQSILLQAESTESHPEGLILALRAEILFAQNKLSAAAKAASESLHLTGDNVNLLNLLGKIYLRLRDFSLAEKFLQKATEISPNNVERVCLIAETRAEQQDADGVKKALAQAEKIDDESDTLVESKARIALIGGDSASLSESLSHIGSNDSVIRFMNNRAVLLAKSEKFDECIKLYKTALKGIPSTMNSVKPVIAYNLGLALVKQGNLEKALSILKFATAVPSSPVFQKAQSMITRASDAFAKGKPVKLNLAQDKETEIEDCLAESAAGLPSAAGIRPGEACLHGIFTVAEQPDTKVISMINSADGYFRKRR